MGILDRLKKNRQDDEDDDEDDASPDGDEEDSEDDDSGRGGLWGRFGALRGIGGDAAGMLGKVLKRGGDDDDEEDDDDQEVAARPAPAVVAGPPGDSSGDTSGDSLADFLSGDSDGKIAADGPDEESPDDEEESDEDELLPPPGLVPFAGATAGADKVSARAGIFAVRIVVDPALKDLAMSQDAVSARDLADNLKELVDQLFHGSAVN